MRVEVSNTRRTATPPSARLVLSIACAATFLAFLDAAIINLIFGTIGSDFSHSSQHTLTWVVTGFAVCFAAGLSVGGQLAESLGHRALLVIGTVGFASTSALCAVAPSVTWLIFARGGQGLTGALLLPAALGALLTTLPIARMPAAIGAWGASASLAAAIGPSVGAILVDLASWRAAFYINIPACGLLLAATLSAFPRTTLRAKIPDIGGALCLAAGTACVVASLTQSSEWGYGSPYTFGLAIIGILTISIALRRSHTHPRPVIPAHLLRRGAFAAAGALNAVVGASLFAHLLAVPLALMNLWRMSLLQAAGAVAIIGVAAMVGALVAGRFANAQSARWFVATGFGLIAIEFALLASVFGSSRSWALWTMLALTAGIGVGTAVSALSLVVAATLTPVETAAGMGLTLTCRQIGGALGVALLAAVLAEGHDPTFLDSFHELFAILCVIALLGSVAAVATLLVPKRTPLPEGQL